MIGPTVAGTLREVAYRLEPRPGFAPPQLPFRLAALSPDLVIETRVAHLDDRGHVWRILDVFGPRPELERARAAFQAYRPAFLVEKQVLGKTRGRLILWYKYRPPRPHEGTSQTSLAFRLLGRDTVLTDRTARGALTVRVLARPGPRLRRFLESAEKASRAGFVFRLLYSGTPRTLEAAALSLEEVGTLREAHERGYFAVPRRIGLAQLGRHLGLSASAVGYRLRAAERKLAGAYLGSE